MIIDGKKIALSIYKNIKYKIENNSKKPRLIAILVGNNSASLRYIKQKEKWALYCDIEFELIHLKEDISQDELKRIIEKLNKDINVSGYIVQLPLPKHINTQEIIDLVDPKKDVDGFHPENQGKLLIGDNSGFIPCTPAGIIYILDKQNIDFNGKQAVVVGRSNIVGKPTVSLLINKGCTVTSCNSKTKNIANYTKHADIVVMAVGKAGLLKSDMIKKDAIIIDVGFSIIDGKIYGDCDTIQIDKLGAKITPVPGGVGAMTVAMLMQNTLKAFLNNL